MRAPCTSLLELGRVAILHSKALPPSMFGSGDFTGPHRARLASPTTVLSIRLFALVLLDCLLDFGFYGIQVERSRCLHRRKLDGRLRKLGYGLLHVDEPPEFARKKVVRVATGGIIERLAADGWRALERILSDVHNGGHVGLGLLPWPAEWLLVELILVAIQVVLVHAVANLASLEQPIGDVRIACSSHESGKPVKT